MVSGVDDLLMQARQGDASVLGSLLERYRGYLTLLARVEIGRHLQSKLDASDVVQETFLEAHRHFERFRGADEAPLRRWLRQILATTLAGQVRRYLGTRGRDVRLEQQLGEELDHSEAAFDGQGALLRLGRLCARFGAHRQRQAGRRDGRSRTRR